MMRRRFVNLVAENYKTGAYSLHRLDVSKDLFYPSRAEAQAAANGGGGPTPAAALPILPRLPAPCASFQPCPTTLWDMQTLPMFALVSPRSSEGRIICCNDEGHCLLYDADTRSSESMPTQRSHKGVKPLTIPIARPGSREDDLYVLHQIPWPRGNKSSFDVLRLEFKDGVHAHVPHCQWETLAQPPFRGMMDSHALIDGGRTISISVSNGALGTGTFCFDTVNGEWTKASDWVLPFRGGAEFISDLNLWFGFSESIPHHLCAARYLDAIEAEPPKVEHVLPDLDVPNNWWPESCRLINLGEGRLCIVKVFRALSGPDGPVEIEEPDDYDPFLHTIDDYFAVITGIELVATARPGDGEPDRLHLVTHKSHRYILAEDLIGWVL